MILCMLCFYFWLLIGVYMLRNKNKMTNIMLQAMTMICNTILIIESTHKKAIFTFLKVLTYKIGSNIVFLHLLHR